jgi:hypothetical protein
MQVDGAEVNDNLVPILGEGEHQVDVWLGENQ